MTAIGAPAARPEADTNRGVELAGRISNKHGLVKIDGLREVAHAVAAARAGTDLVGFIFAPARRRVTPELAHEAIVAARAVNANVLGVGVFVDAAASEVNEVAELAGLDLVQLHGDEPPEMLRHVRRPVFKAFRPPQGTSVRDVDRQFAAYRDVENAPLLYLIDGYVPGVAGGTGARADWDVASALAQNWPVCLAGGLGPENVGAAIDAVRPLGVDVSSGVETDGVKDPARMSAFVGHARAAFVRVGSTTN